MMNKLPTWIPASEEFKDQMIFGFVEHDSHDTVVVFDAGDDVIVDDDVTIAIDVVVDDDVDEGSEFWLSSRRRRRVSPRTSFSARRRRRIGAAFLTATLFSTTFSPLPLSSALSLSAQFSVCFFF